jgi:hypothetical protein
MNRMASPLAAELKRNLLTMVGAIVVLDGIAIGLYYALDIKSAAPRTQAIYSGVWTAVTLAVVLTILARIRRARIIARRRARG